MKPLLLVGALVGIASLGGAGAVATVECAGIPFADRITVDATDLTLNGIGQRIASRMKVKVYVAALYVAKPSTDAAALIDPSNPKQLTLHFLRNVTDDELRKAIEVGFEQNAKSQLAALQPRIDQLRGWISNMTTGEMLTFTNKPGAGIEVDVNGKVAGTIPGDDFSSALFSVWLGDHPPDPGLKAGLLGASCK